MDKHPVSLVELAALPGPAAFTSIVTAASDAYLALPLSDRPEHGSDWISGYEAALTEAVAQFADLRARIAAEIRAAGDESPKRDEEEQTGFTMRLMRASYYEDAAKIAERGPHAG